MRVDALVEGPIADVAAQYRVNLLSEEIGLVDVGSATTLVIDPLDGSANGAGRGAALRGGGRARHRRRRHRGAHLLAGHRPLLARGGRPGHPVPDLRAA